MRRKKLTPEARAQERMIRQERQRRAREHAEAVAAGVAETVALSRARGEAIAEPAAGRGARAQPYRRQSGLDWLAAKGRIDAERLAAGQRYGAAYRRVKLEKAIPSTLDVRIRGGFAPPALEDVLTHGEGTEAARRRLREYRGRLWRQPDLVAACDLICGEEKTPREAGAGDPREASRLEALVKVALDVLAG